MAQRTTTATKCCLKTEAELNFLAGRLYTDLVLNGRTFGTAAAIEDNARKGMTSFTNIRKAMPDGDASTGIKVDVKYQIPRCEESATDDVTFDCLPAADAKPDYAYDEFFFTDYVAEEFTMGITPFLTSCETPSEELAKELVYRVQSMYAKYNRKLLTKLEALAGSTYEGSTATSIAPVPLKLFVENGLGQAVPQPAAIYDLIYQFQRMAPNNPMRPVKIAGTKGLGAYQEGRRIFEGNVEGQDASDDAGNPLSGVYTDWQMNDILADAPVANPMISYMPGAVDLVEWFEYDNPDKQLVRNGRVTWAPVQSDGELVRQKVDVGTPILGRKFEVDLQIYYDKCNNKVTYKMRKVFDLWHIPQGAFCAGTTWNYILLWDIVCGPYQCVDILGDPYTPPAP